MIALILNPQDWRLFNIPGVPEQPFAIHLGYCFSIKTWKCINFCSDYIIVPHQWNKILLVVANTIRFSKRTELSDKSIDSDNFSHNTI